MRVFFGPRTWQRAQDFDLAHNFQDPNLISSIDGKHRGAPLHPQDPNVPPLNVQCQVSHDVRTGQSCFGRNKRDEYCIRKYDWNVSWSFCIYIMCFILMCHLFLILYFKKPTKKCTHRHTLTYIPNSVLFQTASIIMNVQTSLWPAVYLYITYSILY